MPAVYTVGNEKKQDFIDWAAKLYEVSDSTLPLAALMLIKGPFN